jgi:Tol biopolymer transport system component
MVVWARPIDVDAGRASPAAAAMLASGTTERVSLASDGSETIGGNSEAPFISADGRFVVFVSESPNLVSPPTGHIHIFVRDRATLQTTLVSVVSGGEEFDGDSFGARISADGRVVAFYSFAENWIEGTNHVKDVFVHDRATGETFCVSQRPGGGFANAGSADPSISADGRFVAFWSAATNLVDGDNNEARDVFLHDREITRTYRISVRSGGGQALGGHSVEPSISGDGRYVAFSSFASNLVDGDDNEILDVFVHDRVLTETVRISESITGTSANDSSNYPSISADGRFVAFASRASNLVVNDTNGKRDIFVYDRLTGDMQRASLSSDGAEPNNKCERPIISPDGRYVVFFSAASNLVPGDDNNVEDVFLHDLWTRQTVRVSVSSNGEQGNGLSRRAAVSRGGLAVAFHSKANNLVPGDGNGKADVFVHEPRRLIALPFILRSDEG